MSRIETELRRASRAQAQPRAAQNANFRRECFLLFTLLGLATITMLLTADIAWAQLHEGEEVVTVANAYWVRLRSTPEIRPDTILTRVAGGAQLRYLGSADGWFKVELPHGSEGWLHNRYGRLDSARDLLKVSASVARIRETPQRNSPVVGRAIQGLMLEIIEREDPWYLVRLPLGEEGWVREDLVELHTVEPKVEQDEAAANTRPEPVEARPEKVEEPEDETAGTSLLEITPLPISATASSDEDGSVPSSPTLRSPKDSNKPRFLMLFVSVVAGLSAFAVILMVGAVAMRRKQRAAPPIETGKKETAPSPNKEELNKEYSDPILSWMAKTPAGPKTGVSDDIQIDQDDSEATIISVHEEEPSRIEKQPLDLGHSYESETSAEKGQRRMGKNILGRGTGYDCREIKME